MPRETVVITGVGIVSPIGIGATDFFDALLQGKSGIRSLADRTDRDARPPTDTPIDGVWIGAPIVDFDAKQFVRPRKALKVMCREIQMAFAASELAIQHAGLSEHLPSNPNGPLKPDRVAVVFGSEIFFNPPEELADSIRRCLDHQGRVQTGQFGDAAKREIMPLWMLKYLPNMPACQVGISVNAQGPNNSLILGDVSGPAALIECVSYLQRGLADLALVGATGTQISAMRLCFRHDYPIVERGTHDLADVSRPHQPDASGVVGGEAAATVALETAEHCENRNGTVLARVLASASRFFATEAMKSSERSADRQSVASRGAKRAIELSIFAVLESARVHPQQIGLVVSHGLGDQQVDTAERQALQHCGIQAPLVAASASIGHVGAASGMIDIALGTLALSKQMIPPTRNATADDPSGLLVQAQPLQSPYVLCLSHTTEGSAIATLLSR